MELIVGGRQSGKTYRLVEQAINGGVEAMIVVPHLSSMSPVVAQIVGICEARGLDTQGTLRRIHVVVSGATLPHHCPVFIDDVDVLLGSQYPHIISAAGNILVGTPQGVRFDPTMFPRPR